MSIDALMADVGLEIVQSVERVVGGKKIKLYARELPADEVENLFDGLRDEAGRVSPAGNRVLRNRIVAASICNAGGVLYLPVEDVGKVPSRLLGALTDFALEVNGLTVLSESEEKKEQPGGQGVASAGTENGVSHLGAQTADDAP